MFFKSIAAVALLATSVSAQAGANSTINPTSVSSTLRSQWCGAQMNSCGTLCSGDTTSTGNTCDPDTLSFNCTCAANNSAPGLAYYTGTMPTFICEYNFQTCITNTVGVKASQDKCNADEKTNCGHLDPNSFVAVASSSSSSASATASATSAGASGASATNSAASTSTSKGAAATMLAIGGEYGAGMVAAGVAAAFGLMI